VVQDRSRPAPDADAPASSRARGGAPLVELRGITKRFGTLVANDAVDLDLEPGAIHALLGENGAGKTTLMRILYGLVRADAGEITVAGRRADIRSPRDAIAAGVGMVTQHFSLVRPMTVAENLVLGRPGGVRLDLRAATREVEAASERFGIRVKPSARVDSLSVGEQQRVEILKALSRECRVLILDEPTAVLVPQEVDVLFQTLRRLASSGMAIVFISHKLREVVELTGRVTVLRRGRVVASVATASVDARALAQLMVGDIATAPIGRKAARPGPALLRLDGVTVLGGHGLPALRDISMEVSGGEIVGVAGVSGNGQTELVETLSGMRPPSSGSIVLDGAPLHADGVPEMLRAGIGRIPEDRHQSVISEMSVAYNLVLEHLDEFRTRDGRLDERRIRRHADELIDRFDIRAQPRDPVRTLSGGNMQKVILARVLSRDPVLLVVSQPTRGLDVGATEYVRAQLLEQRARGAGVLLVSEDLDELLALSDRLVVLYEGRITGSMATADADVGRLGLLMAGRADVAA
jgi:simple sugar transport system ATP-binding protein